MLRRAFLALVSVALAVLMPACGYKKEHHHHGHHHHGQVVEVQETTVYKEKKALRPKKATKVKTTEVKQKTVEAPEEEVISKTETTEVVNEPEYEEEIYTEVQE